MRMAAGGREITVVGGGISDIWYPHPKKFSTKYFLTISKLSIVESKYSQARIAEPNVWPYEGSNLVERLRGVVDSVTASGSDLS